MQYFSDLCKMTSAIGLTVGIVNKSSDIIVMSIVIAIIGYILYKVK